MSETSTIVTPALCALNGIPGVWARRLQSGQVKVRGAWMHLGAKGAPDFFAVVRGRAVFFEAKLAGEKTTPEQVAEHRRIARAGAQTFVVRSVREAVDVVREMLREEP